MPGTIRVSVLDLMDIPSSASSSPVSIKVAMGNREFQTYDKGDFLFPLTTLRDNLIVTLRDAEGNEISRTDVATMSVVQKGLWDDLFPLEGGGLIHMKLQFILSEEDHKRIQDMREAAVKKKQGELGKRSVDHSETPTDVAAGDLQESAVPTKAIGVSEEPIKGSNLETIEHIEDIQSSSDVQHNRPKQTAPMEVGIHQRIHCRKRFRKTVNTHLNASAAI
ncbi:uncharacterized protein LOC131222741 isoform X2 [Magnolia sinica]|uniref:uncharacterized protein LOC131222741 isoform X2 n=1 Tax=Magnolia sinica TaxID=86752 RepID=UPI0026580560|nr:uncharacterized protein LOC131222741 isoform X2 [Magnolia sinica]